MSKTNSTNASSPNELPVLIVGAGPVGLAMAVLMDRFRIPYVVVERGDGPTDHPKARGCWSRTMEIFRQWGIESKVRAGGLAGDSDVFAFVDCSAGREFGRTTPEPDLGQTPSWKTIVAQDVVEKELMELVSQSKLGRVLYGTEFESYDEVELGVRVRTRNVQTGEAHDYLAKYLIGADGAGSRVRRAAGIDMVGPSTLAVMANEYWHADLSMIPGVRHVAGFRTFPQNGEPLGSVLNTNGRDRWLSLIQVGSEEDERPQPWAEADVIAIARKQVGIPDLPVQLISRSIWRMSRQVAATFRQGRVFLVGDSAHRFPPTGGFGMNSGIQDAHNLAWKLHFVLSGRASEKLLDSYDVERRPVAQSNADFSYGNRLRVPRVAQAFRSGNADAMRFWIKDTENHIHSIGQSLGFTYEQGVVIQDGTAKNPMQPRYYEPSDRPGGRFPHRWLDAKQTRSTLDWFDKEFVLVAGPQADEWMSAARDVSARLGGGLQLRQMDAANEADGFWMGPKGAVLVRPDGHVAWRMPWTPSNPSAELSTALESLLA